MLVTRAFSYGKFPLLKLFTVGQSADETAGGTVVTACTSPDDALKETYVPTFSNRTGRARADEQRIDGSSDRKQENARG